MPDESPNHPPQPPFRYGKLIVFILVGAAVVAIAFALAKAMIANRAR